MDTESERDWIVHSHIRIYPREYRGKTTWVAEDSVGVVAIAATKDELIRLLHDMGATH